MIFNTMPELPEVETLKRELGQVLMGKRFQSVKIFWPKAIVPLSPARFARELKNRKIESVERRAKIIFLNLDNRKTLAIHLKMTGQLIYYPNHNQGSTLEPAKVEPLILGGHSEDPTKYTRAIFSFIDGSRLYFNDLRKFGWIRLLGPRAIADLHKHHGQEPLAPGFTVSVLGTILDRYPQRTLKALLLDQTIIAGLGNIYVDESCFAARINPGRRGGTLANMEKRKLHHAIRAVLALAIKHGGTSARDYRRSDGARGGFAAHLKVYGRGAEPCRRCRTLIRKIKLAGRGTHFCPRCQK